MAIDRATLELTQVDAARIKIRNSKGKFWFDPLIVSDGVKEYSILFYPMVSKKDVKLGVDQSKWAEIINVEDEGEMVQSEDEGREKEEDIATKNNTDHGLIKECEAQFTIKEVGDEGMTIPELGGVTKQKEVEVVFQSPCRSTSGEKEETEGVTSQFEKSEVITNEGVAEEPAINKVAVGCNTPSPKPKTEGQGLEAEMVIEDAGSCDKESKEESKNRKRAKKLLDECVVINSDDEKSGKDSPRVTLAKKVGKEILLAEAEAQLNRLDDMGPLTPEEQGRLVHWLE